MAGLAVPADTPMLLKYESLILNTILKPKYESLNTARPRDWSLQYLPVGVCLHIANTKVLTRAGLRRGEAL